MELADRGDNPEPRRYRPVGMGTRPIPSGTYRFRRRPRYHGLLTRTAIGTGDSADEGSSLDLPSEFGRRKYEEDEDGLPSSVRDG